MERNAFDDRPPIALFRARPEVWVALCRLCGTDRRRTSWSAALTVALAHHRQAHVSVGSWRLDEHL